jgi:transposase
MPGTRKTYDASFKRDAVRLADTSGKHVTTVEKELGLYQGAIRHWREELKADPENAFPGTGHLKPLEAENLLLRRELASAREERDILKKAIAIFSKTQKTNTCS